MLGGISLGVQPVLARMPDINAGCVLFGVTDVKCKTFDPENTRFTNSNRPSHSIKRYMDSILVHCFLHKMKF